MGYDVAVTLATLGTALDGDVVTGKLSIGCDATSRTSATGDLLGDEVGLEGHNVRIEADSFVAHCYSITKTAPQRFEGDTSLTRNDYFLADGDNYDFNGTLFTLMQQTCKGNFDRDNLALYRYQRYQQSLAENGTYYFGPTSLLLFGAASFLYELFPSLGPAGDPDLATMESFFGASSDGSGGYTFNNAEQIPANWYSRVSPYSLTDVSTEIGAQYNQHPVLFGGNVGPGNFDALSYGIIVDGNLTDTSNDALLCLIYQLATQSFPSSLSGVLDLPAEVVTWSTGKLNPIFKTYGCPLIDT